MGKRLVLFISFISIFSVFLLSDVFASVDLLSNPCLNKVFCLADAFNNTNNMSIVVCAGTNTPVHWFNFWYNGTGPFNMAGGIVNASYYNSYEAANNGSAYNNEFITNQTNMICVNFVLNSTAAFTRQAIEINATAYNLTNYAQAASQCDDNPINASCNGTMFTANYVHLEVRDASGNINAKNAILMPFSNATKSFSISNPAGTDDSGSWAEHCFGFINTTSNTCQPIISGQQPSCAYHGDPFNESTTDCAIMATATLYAIDVVNANSSQINVTPRSPIIINVSTPTAMSMIMAFNWNPMSQQQMSSASVSRINISDYFTNELLFNITSEGGDSGEPGGEGEEKGSPPAFLQPYTNYKISFNLSNIIYAFPFMTPTSGMTSAQIFIANSTFFDVITGYKTIIGKVVNESNNPIVGAVVYAQFYKGPGGVFGISLFNSSVTDSNGRFSMRVPKTLMPGETGNPGGDMYFPVYQFYIVGNQTSSNGIPIYFPTIDNNNNKGYFVLSDPTVLPPLVLKRGGQININVTLNNATQVMSELSKFVTLGTGLSRDAATGKFTMTSVFGDVLPPSSILVSLLSPVGGVSELVVNLFGKSGDAMNPTGGGIINICFNNSATVTQGVATSLTCNLTQPGYLNITVQSCTDIFDVDLSDSAKCANINDDSRRDKRAGTFDFWFNTNGIIYNSTGQGILYIAPEGILLENLLGFSSSSPNITVPLPPGTYSIELMPPFEFSNYLSVRNGTTFTITAGTTSNIQMIRGESWDIRPMFNPSLVLSGSNSINVSVYKKNNPNPLNNSHITLSGTKIVLLNKSDAAPGSTITFSYDSNRKVFYNTTFNPSSLGLSAGKYMIMFNATNITGNDKFSTIMTMPIHAYDFQVGLDLGGFTFGTNQTVSGKVFVFNTSANSPVGLNSSSGNVTVKVYDMTGAEFTSITSSPSDVTNGQGTVNITMPNTLGFYEVVVSVKTDGCVATGCTDNAVGVADNWVQISNINIKTITDRQDYQAADNVILTVQVSNASSGAKISGATIEVTVDNSDKPAFATTDSDGKATINLDPVSYAGSGSTTWSAGWHNLKIKISKDTGSDVLKLDTWTGFGVRGFDLFLRSDRPTYEPADNVTIVIYGPPGSFTIPKSGVEVDGTTLAECFYDDGSCTALAPGVNYHINDAWDTSSKNVELGNWSVGHHDVEITISYGGSEQKFYVGFDVNSYKIVISTDSFSYDLNDNITLSVKASYPNGTAVSNQAVNATLYKAQPPNDIYVTQDSSSLNTSGQATIKLNATQPGFNYIKINISNQLQYIGMQISSLKVSLLNSSRNEVTNYDAAPGDTVTIYVNATSGGSNVPDGSTVTASLWSFGNRVDLPSNTTTNGNATITFQISSFVPTQVYGLEVRLTTPTGDQGFAPQATLTVAGGSALQLSVSADRSFLNPYSAGDTASFTAKLTYLSGTGVSGHNITFEAGSEGTKPQTLGSAITGTGGLATKSFSIALNNTDGPYYVHAYITNNTDIQAYSGFLVSNLKIDIITNRTYYLGQNIILNVTLNNRTSGAQLNATSAFAVVFNKDKGSREIFYNPSGQVQPYQISISIPNETSAVGTYPIAVVMFRNQYQGVGFTMVNVKNASLNLNLDLPSNVTANTPFLVNLSSSVTGTATLRVFSPTASSVVYENTSIALSTGGTPNATVNLTIADPGIYVFNLFVSGVGANTSIVSVLPASTGTIPSVWTGTSTSANATTFISSQSVYVMSNIANTTANILMVNIATNTTVSTSLPLTLNASDTYYGIFNSTNLGIDMVSGRKYFVRLDTSTTTGVANTMFIVTLVT